MAFLVATTSLPAVYRPNGYARTTTAGTPHARANISIKDFYHSGKIYSLFPYQPVCSKEIALKIEQIEKEEKKGSNKTSFSFYSVDCDCSVKVGNLFIT